MSNFEDLFSNIKNQVTELAKEQVKEYTDQAISEAYTYLEVIKSKLEDWEVQLARNEIDKEEFVWLVDTQMAIGQMKILVRAGLPQIKIDAFINGIKKIVVTSLLTAVEAI